MIENGFPKRSNTCFANAQQASLYEIISPWMAVAISSIINRWTKKKFPSSFIAAFTVSKPPRKANPQAKRMSTVQVNRSLSSLNFSMSGVMTTPSSALEKDSISLTLSLYPIRWPKAEMARPVIISSSIYPSFSSAFFLLHPAIFQARSDRPKSYRNMILPIATSCMKLVSDTVKPVPTTIDRSLSPLLMISSVGMTHPVPLSSLP